MRYKTYIFFFTNLNYNQAETFKIRPSNGNGNSNIQMGSILYFLGTIISLGRSNYKMWDKQTWGDKANTRDKLKIKSVQSMKF